MSKASMVASLLLEGKTIEKYKEAGNSMLPILKSNQPVTLVPVNDIDLKENDIVFCKVKGNYYTHKITEIKKQKDNIKYQISNNHGFINGWVKKDNIYGIVTKIWK